MIRIENMWICYERNRSRFYFVRSAKERTFILRKRKGETNQIDQSVFIGRATHKFVINETLANVH